MFLFKNIIKNSNDTKIPKPKNSIFILINWDIIPTIQADIGTAHNAPALNIDATRDKNSCFTFLIIITCSTKVKSKIPTPSKNTIMANDIYKLFIFYITN